ncbi:hypothetical protein OIU85_000295 [Salix viminalis]|uniref:Protein argonaute N-terminal domain-containing protein n=1 Tax=Salix viminalis TaxID=40686 RepID=A0A9Q0VJY0_SALVM|nr:hypothetical protein OIU85_000295 [Salix viminalis]
MSRRGGSRRSLETRRDQDSSNPSPSFQRGGDGGRGRGRGGRGGFTHRSVSNTCSCSPPCRTRLPFCNRRSFHFINLRETASSLTPPPASSSTPPPASSSASVEAISQEMEKKLSFKSITTTGGSVPVSSKAIVPPPRPQYGSKGRKCVIQANHFVVEVFVRDLFQYDVRPPPFITYMNV